MPYGLSLVETSSGYMLLDKMSHMWTALAKATKRLQGNRFRCSSRLQAAKSWQVAGRSLDRTLETAMLGKPLQILLPQMFL